MDFACPNCVKPLAVVEHGDVRWWSCESCGGCAVALAALRKERDTATLAHFWGLARSGAATSGKRCASCARPAAQVSLELADGPLVLDVCKMCQMVWFDRDELERIPKQPQRAVEPPRELPPEAKVAYAQAMVSMMQERLREENQREQTVNTASRILTVLDLLT